MTINNNIMQDIATNCNFSTTNISYRVKSIGLVRTTRNNSSYSPYLKSYIAWDKLERANKPISYTDKTKYLSKNSKALLAVIMQKLRKQDSVFLNHKYISTVTRCGRRQNQNIIKELFVILDISYHNSFVCDHRGKKYRYCYEFSRYNSDRLSLSDLGASNSSTGQKISRQSDSSTIYRENNILNNRSNESNFNINNFKEKSTLTLSKQLGDNYTFQEQAANKPVREKKIKKLSDFYPLGPEDCSELQSKSGRNFTLTAMNEILKDMSSRLLSPEFWSKKGFISYMSKAFSYEKRNEFKISGENFRINANKSQEEKDMAKKEKYLQEIEYSLQVSPQWHFKKKLACVLTTNTAYSLLKAYRSSYHKDEVFVLELHKKIDLTAREKEIILSQAKAVFEILSFTGECVLFKRLEIVYPKAVDYNNNPCDKQNEAQEPSFSDDIWGKVRKVIVEGKGEEGKYMDRNWLSKLYAKIDNEQNILKLYAPTDFIKDWVSENYLPWLERATKAHGFSLRPISTSYPNRRPFKSVGKRGQR